MTWWGRDDNGMGVIVLSIMVAGCFLASPTAFVVCAMGVFVAGALDDPRLRHR